MGGFTASYITNDKLNVQLSESNIQQPMEVQGVLSIQDKRLTAYSVSAGASVNITASAVQMEGFTQASLVVTTGTSHNFDLKLLASPDGVAVIDNAIAQATPTGAGTNKYILPIKSPTDYLVIQITNNDASARTYDVWVRRTN
ncbi:hypothetical protein ACFX4N_23615 [Priestia sp. YIM B13551]|uniref:hypothetical protein n=1 Tax=Priestia sp. YIM B13551 TaxID=3366306 RepID=UPI0036701E95